MRRSAWHSTQSGNPNISTCQGWVGMYPVSFNDVDQDVEWHINVKCGGVMAQEHDLFMLQKLHGA